MNLNFSGLTQEMQVQTGEFSSVAGIARAIREEGLTGNSAKDPRKPQVEGVHGVSGLFAVIAKGAQAQAGDNVRKLWKLAPMLVQARQRDGQGTETIGPALHIETDKLMFGQAVGMIMELLSLPPRLDSSESVETGLYSLGAVGTKVPDYLEDVAIWVWQGCTQACIDYKTFRVIYAAKDREESIRRDNLLTSPNMIETVTKAPRASLERLGRLVRASRLEAWRRGIEIPTDTAWKALGFVKPEGDFTLHPLVELPQKEPSGSSVKNAATALPGAVAAVDDQPAKQAAPLNNGHPTRARTQSASAEPQVGLLQPIDAEVYRDYGSQYELCCAVG